MKSHDMTRRELVRNAVTAGAALALPRALRAVALEQADASNLRWLGATAYHIPSQYTTEESGYQSLGEGKNGKIYIGAAKYGFNAYLVEFDPASGRMRAAGDAMKAIGSNATGFAAQAKIHTHL